MTLALKEKEKNYGTIQCNAMCGSRYYQKLNKKPAQLENWKFMMQSETCHVLILNDFFLSLVCTVECIHLTSAKYVMTSHRNLGSRIALSQDKESGQKTKHINQ